ncbi:glycosyl hydrolase [Tetragenococcus halophilus subsp. flandriensis]|uniref:glycoside hydrolase family 65 protein n=1 Tax=Tetragenococcus halophilus TaxID=51669 RepID=UPI0023E9CE15|nr:glycosyl hydrolase family 65 protein [Tetragenococcus halophilus]GMA07670.1 glycosyl hydrolase [Tetragenococcus halophilus subsp. flandriensis]
MYHIRIETTGQWIVHWPNGNTEVLSAPLNECLSYLTKEIKAQSIEGGTIDQETLFEKDGQTFALAQYLTEETNRPFICGTAKDFDTKAEQIPWNIEYYGYNPGKNEYSQESLLTVGNGFIGLRGTTPEMEISDNNYPALYLASLYNEVGSQVADKTIYNEDFVNAPNLQKMYLVVDGQRIDIENNQVLYMKRQLNLKNGLLSSYYTLQLDDGKKIAIQTKKIASMENVHQYAISYSFTPLNFSGEVTFISEADGDVYNYNVERYRSLSSRHLQVTKLQADKEMVSLLAKTNTSNITVSQQAKLRGFQHSLDNLIIEEETDKVMQKVPLTVEEQNTYTFEKTVLVNQYRIEDEVPVIDLQAVTLPTFNECLQASNKEWATLWKKAGIHITGDLMSQKLLNLHTYHLLVSASPKGNQGLDASVAARGLHGEAYRGHIFWDELFIFPFYILHFPEIIKPLLLYRYNRLEMAKKEAKEVGYQGAMFPWQSSLDGSEQSQDLHLNPISGAWKKDNSRLQRHISLAIAYNIWLYWHNTQDISFMKDYGLEMLLEIAHFWESAAVYNPASKRYDVDHVMGPDEFHESYPEAKESGLKNNAYTNMMVVWLFEEIGQIKNEFSTTDFATIQKKTGVNDQLLEKMDEIKQQLSLEIDSKGVIAQFDGYFGLKDLDWQHYKQEYGNIYRMDRILNAEGKSADDYKVAKQADSLMIFYNFSKEQVSTILKDLDYQVPADYVQKNLNYYLARTSHGSTLSRVVHAQLAAMVGDQDLSWQLYQEALYSDYRDIQGGTTAEGIHAGVMAATLYIPLTTFAGLDIRKDIISFEPNLPQAWSSIQFSITIRDIDFTIFVSHETITITPTQTTFVEINHEKIELSANEQTTITY